MVERLCGDLLPWCRSPAPSLVPGDRGKGRLFELARMLSNPGYHNLGSEKVVANAKTVDLNRIALPVEAAGCDPAAHMQEPERSRYLDVDALRLPPHLWTGVRKACHKVRVQDEASLALLLWKRHGLLC